MDKVPYVLIGIFIGSVITAILMALLFVAKREDESLERLFKAKKEREAKASNNVDGRVAEESIDVSDGVSENGSSEIPKETVEDAPSADSVDKGAKFVKVTPKSDNFIPFPGELIEWDTYFNGKHPLDT